MLLVVGVLAILALLVLHGRRVRIAAVGAVLAALLLAPAVWAFDTLGHATSGTFPSGGPASVANAGGPGGGPGLGGRGTPARSRRRAAQGSPPALFGAGRLRLAAAGAAQRPGQALGPAQVRGRRAPSGHRGRERAAEAWAPRAVAGVSGGPLARRAVRSAAPIGGSLTSTIVAYVKQHGGGTVAVASQSSAASSIISGDVQGGRDRRLLRPRERRERLLAGPGGALGARSAGCSTKSAAGRAGGVRRARGPRRAAAARLLFGAARRRRGGRPGGETRVGSKRSCRVVEASPRRALHRARLVGTPGGLKRRPAAGSLYDCSGAPGDRRLTATAA